MAQENAEQEPTMEEILASIRRIINEDDDKPAEAAAAAPAPQPEPEPEPEPESEPEIVADPEPEPVMDAEFDGEPEPDDVLELTERVEEEPEPEADQVAPVADDLMIVDRDEDEGFATAPAPAPAAPEEEEDTLLGETSASAAAGMFAALSNNLRVSNDQGQTLEGIVRELLRPMLKQWLDENLPAIVEEKVQAEIERVARRRR
ncbi:MAG: DUF2497 domain-containing protein [Oceanicaulis sp.]